MSETKRFYSMAVEGREATIDIYGDICSLPWEEYGEFGSVTLSRAIEQMGDVDRINVNINSYGGEVKEGVAIYNALRRHPAQVVTRCDGMACSIASVIFMAGDERVMYAPSMLMVHNAWTYAAGNAAELHKAAEDIDAINGMAKAAYLERVSISEDELAALMDAESWIGPEQAVEMGFATVVEQHGEAAEPSQDARTALFAVLMGVQALRGYLPDALRAAPARPVSSGDGDGVSFVETGEEDADPEPEPEPDPEPTEGDGEQRAEERAMRSFLMSALA